MNMENYCVICGEVIPEGRWVCPSCERKAQAETMPQLTVNVELDEGAYMPVRAHEADAGYDLRAIGTQIVPARESATFHTGVHIELPKGTAGMLISKSGLNVLHDITSTGLIDEGYTGEIVVKLYNHGGYDYKVNQGDKISQLVFLPVLKPRLKQVHRLEATERGDDGFGSTGK